MYLLTGYTAWLSELMLCSCLRVCFFQTITLTTSEQAAAAVAVAIPHDNERPHTASPAAGRHFRAPLTLNVARQGAPERSCFPTTSD